MSDAEIDKAVKEAQKYQAEDKKRKEAVEIKNNADQLIYQSGKILKESADKISEQEKQSIKTNLESLKEAAAANAQNGANNTSTPSGKNEKKDGKDVVDVDYTDVEDDKK